MKEKELTEILVAFSNGKDSFTVGDLAKFLSDRFRIVSREKVKEICDRIEYYANDGDSDYASHYAIQALNELLTDKP